ncbi:MAG TPA: hypothetical protein VGK96_00005, partial [Candidatus Sulfotelmatobacter sp.]
MISTASGPLPEMRGQTEVTLIVTVRRVAQASEFLLPIPELWVPRPCVFCKGGYDAADSVGSAMLVVAVNVGWGRFPFAIVWLRNTPYSAAKRLGHPPC